METAGRGRTEGGLLAIESPDARLLYFARRFMGKAIWRRSLTDGRESFVTTSRITRECN